MVLDDIARIVCQIDRAYPLYLRAITLFGFQVAILCPNQARRESKARVLAALKILESLETGVQSDVNLESRLEIPDYRDVLNAIMREGGAKAIRVAGTTEDFWKEIKKRLVRSKKSQKWSNSPTGSPSFLRRLLLQLKLEAQRWPESSAPRWAN